MRSAANRGKVLETIVEMVNRKHLIYNAARIDKVPTPMKKVGKEAFYSSKSTVDFVGVVDGGKMIAFDAKQVSSGSRFSLKRVEPHQMEYLKDVYHFGGIAFILIWFCESDKFYKLHYFEILTLLKDGKKSVNEKAIEEYEVCKIGGLPDFL